MKRFAYILILLAALLCQACGDGHADGMLNRAEALMDSCPEQSLTILEAMSPDSLSDSQRALHALLLSQACDKNYIDLTTDSIIRIATDYYEDSDDLRRKMLANFYLSRIYFNKQDYYGATSSAKKALDLAEELQDYYWLAKTHEHMANICSKTFSYEESSYNYLKASEYYKKADKTINYYYSTIDLGNSYNVNDELAKSISLLDSIKNDILENVKDSVLIYYSLSSLFIPLVKANLLSEAKAVLDSMTTFSDRVGKNFHSYLFETKYYLTQNDIKTASEKLDSAYMLVADSASFLMAEDVKQVLLAKTGNYKNAYNLSVLQIQRQNKVVKESLKQSVTKGLQEYYKIQNNKAETKLESTRAILVVVIISVSVLLIIIYLYLRLLNEKRKADLEHRTNEILSLSELLNKTELNYSSNIDRLSSKIKHKDNEISCLKVMLAEYFRGHFSTINKVVDENILIPEDQQSIRIVFEKVNSELKKLQSPVFLKELENQVNLCFDSLLEKAKNQIPSLNKDEISILSLFAAGISAQVVAIIRETKVKTLYAQRKRIRDKISESDSEIKAELLDMLN